MTHPTLAELRSADDVLSFCWLGNLSWLIAHRDRLIAFDLDLHLDLRLRPSPIPVEAIAPDLDLLFITHEHGDHFNAETCAVLAAQSECTFVIPENCEQKARDIGIPPSRIHIAHPREPFAILDLHIEPLRALHGDRYSAVYRHANMEDCGYLITLGGKRILQPGDTVLLQDHLELTGIDILFVSPTVHNMYTDRSLILINTLEPSHIFPQHFGTYQQRDDNLFWTRGYPDELHALLPASTRDRFHKLAQGQPFTVS